MKKETMAVAIVVFLIGIAVIPYGNADIMRLQKHPQINENLMNVDDITITIGEVQITNEGADLMPETTPHVYVYADDVTNVTVEENLVNIDLGWTLQIKPPITKPPIFRWGIYLNIFDKYWGVCDFGCEEKTHLFGWLIKLEDSGSISIPINITDDQFNHYESTTIINFEIISRLELPLPISFRSFSLFDVDKAYGTIKITLK